jgi:hypothetical protein
VGNEIHFYFHIVTEPDDSDVAVLRATVAVLEARLAAEVPSVADLATLDVLIDGANSLLSAVDTADAEDRALRRAYGLSK